MQSEHEVPQRRRSAFVAAFLSLLFPGLGHAYLGAPRTTRQSRTLSMVGAVGGVALLRLIGFMSTVFGATIPAMLVLQYVAVAAAIGGGLFVIRTGVILEPPAFLLNAQNAVTAYLARRDAAVSAP